MILCYVDESGCPGALPDLRATGPTPLLVMMALAIPHSRLADLTQGLIGVKRRFFPKLIPAGSHRLSWLPAEVKGAKLRKRLTQSARRRHSAEAALGAVLDLVERCGGKVFGRVWIKPVGGDFDGRKVYTASMQRIAEYLQAMLAKTGETGLVIADGRNARDNHAVSHSLFTLKFKAGGDAYSRILEAPLFCGSHNHAGIQIADFLCSALVYPTAAAVYRPDCLDDDAAPAFLRLRERFGARLRRLQFRYRESGKWRGGIVVSDPGKRSGGLLFAPPAA